MQPDPAARPQAPSLCRHRIPGLGPAPGNVERGCAWTRPEQHRQKTGTSREQEGYGCQGWAGPRSLSQVGSEAALPTSVLPATSPGLPFSRDPEVQISLVKDTLVPESLYLQGQGQVLRVACVCGSVCLHECSLCVASCVLVWGYMSEYMLCMVVFVWLCGYTHTAYVHEHV